MKSIALLFAIIATHSHAQSWTGTISPDWNTTGNWNSGLPVGSPTTALIFDTATQPTTSNSIAGLVLNSLTFGVASGVRTTTGNAITFDGTAPTLRLLNADGTGYSTLGIPLVLNQTLSIEGGPTFDNQAILNSTSVISGVGGVRIVGGITAINAANTYAGQTIVESGGLGVNQSGSFGNSPSVTVLTGAWVQMIGGSFLINKPLTLEGVGDTALLTDGYALAASGGGFKQWQGSVTLSGNATFRSFGGSSLTLAGTSELSLNGHDLTLKTSGNASDSISISKVISGDGNLIIHADPLSTGVGLSGGNTFTGSTLATSGRLSINSNTNFGAASNPVTLNGATLRATTGLTIPSTRPIHIGENGATFRGGDGSSTSQTLVLTSPLSGANPIHIAQRVTLNATNLFTGSITVDPGGTLTAPTDASLGAATSQIRLDGNATADAEISLPVDFDSTRSIAITGTHGYIKSNAPIIIATPLSGPGEVSFSCYGNPITLSVANSHQGGTSLLSGTVIIHDDSAFGPITSPVTFYSQGLLGASQNITIPAARTLRMVGGGGFDTTGVEIHVPGDIDASNNGSLSLSGDGTFRFDGTMTGSIYVVGATVAGTGTFEGFVVADQPATLAPGGLAAPGTLTVGEIRMSDGKLKVRLSSAASDKLVVKSGEIRFSAELEIDVVGPVAVNDTFTILQKQGSGSNFVSLYSATGSYLGGGNGPFVQDGITWSINYTAGNGSDIVLTALTASATPPPLPQISDLVITPGTSSDPANPDYFPKFSGTITHGVPNSMVILESSTDLGLADDWTAVETLQLNASGTATFTNHTVPHPLTLQRNFLRLAIP